MSSSDIQPASDDYADDLVSVDEYEHTVPVEKAFLPWHRPRKQYVRNEQWSHYIGRLIDDIRPVDGTLTYFGLPGVDLLDLRHFGKEICEPKSLKLRFLGFNKNDGPLSQEQYELNISLDEISKTESFDPMSEIVPDDLRMLVQSDSIAWQKTFELGPYDVINLDLCDGFGKQQPGLISQTYYDAVSRLLAIQARRKNPWLLFLTTRVGVNHVHTETLSKLSGVFQANLATCGPFREIAIEKYGLNDASAVDAAVKGDAGVQPVFLAGFCKWLLKMVLGQNPPTTMEVKNVLGYRVKPGATSEDMISIALRFEPTNAVTTDVVGLAKLASAPPNECELATKAIKAISNLVDVDDVLNSDTTVMDEMIEAMSALLEAARYDIAGYKIWALS